MQNEEYRITGAVDIRAEKSVSSPAVFQVIHTWTSINSSAQRSALTDIRLSVEKKKEEPARPKNQIGRDPVSGRDGAFIPHYPEDIASVVRHWVMSCPSEGVHKAPVNVTAKDRNQSALQKKTYSKRKSVCLAFIHFVDLHGIAQYEKKFSPLRKPFCYSKLQNKSSKFISNRRKKNNGALESEKNLAALTDRVCKHLNLKKTLCRRKR